MTGCDPSVLWWQMKWVVSQLRGTGLSRTVLYANFYCEVLLSLQANELALAVSWCPKTEFLSKWVFIGDIRGLIYSGMDVRNGCLLLKLMLFKIFGLAEIFRDFSPLHGQDIRI